MFLAKLHIVNCTHASNVYTVPVVAANMFAIHSETGINVENVQLAGDD